MTRDEWLVVLATEPATATQRGALMGEFRRLGLDRPADRARRLSVCATLLGLDSLGSTGDLAMGQAGQLVQALRQIPSRTDLPAVLAAQGQPADRAARPSIGDLLRAVAAGLAGFPAGNGTITGGLGNDLRSHAHGAGDRA